MIIVMWLIVIVLLFNNICIFLFSRRINRPFRFHTEDDQESNGISDIKIKIFLLILTNFSIQSYYVP